ncbi:Imm50 family immunity protein [Streptomyces sp. NPDC056460]|uniref:Imm50 family immunity protein n=1 Tax=Streptomyces sp. NPDC056460 TaxID=3345825 RepID=UPI0036811CB1
MSVELRGPFHTEESAPMFAIPIPVNAEVLEDLYGANPPLDTFRLRSLNVDWRGPTVTLRVDLSSFPASVPPEWEEHRVDTVQCHLQFLAVEELSLTEWNPPVHRAALAVDLQDERRRMRVRVTGAGVGLGFTSSDSVLVGHVSAFRASVDGGDDGDRHLFSRRIDAMRFQTIPATEEKTFHGRL